jgi:hypothetical protein
MQNITKNAVADKLHDQVSGETRAVKEAAAQWRELEAAFVKYQTTAEQAGHKPTASDSLAWLQSAKNNPLNADKLQAKELPFQSKIAEDSNWKAEQGERLQDQVSQIGLYSDALKESAEVNRLLEAARKRNIVLTPQEIEGYKSLIATVIDSKDYQKELGSVYESVNEIQDTFEARIHALNTAFDAGVLSQDQFNQSISRTIRDYREASSAVVEFQRKLSDQQRDAGNKLGSNQDIAAKGELQGLAESMRKGDATHPGGYSESEIQKTVAAMSGQIKTQQLKNEVDQASNKLIFAQTNLLDELNIREKALNAAVAAGAMSQQAANSQRNKDNLQLNNQQLQSGTGGNPYKGAIADYAKDFTTLASGIESTFKPVFKTLADGFADSIGRAIVYSKNLGSALKDVARSALSELISGMVKLGIQEVIQLAEGTAAGAAATAAGVVQATTLATAWAPAAFAASVATLGSADIVGGAAYASGLAAATALSAVPKLAVGTNYVPNDMYAQIHQGERVIPAADNRDIIGALQGVSTGSSGGKTHIEIVNNAGGYVETQESSDAHIRFIVHAEAPQLIAQHAPTVIAGDIGNPNSKTSKALSRSTFTTRRR